MTAQVKTLVPKVKALVPLLLSGLLSACGHKATEADCQIIVDRNVEVEMKKLNIVDPAAIAKRKDEERNDPKTKADLQGCIGKRITDSMMSCVKQAQTG